MSAPFLQHNYDKNLCNNGNDFFPPSIHYVLQQRCLELNFIVNLDIDNKDTIHSLVYSLCNEFRMCGFNWQTSG